MPRDGSARPLTGVRVVTCESLMALPFSTQILSDLGADILAIEQVSWRDDKEQSAWRLRTGRNKRRIAVNLKSPAGQHLVRRLIASADVFAANMRPGVMKRYGLDYEALSADFPRLVYANVSGFGNSPYAPSPYQDVAAYGPVAEAMGGVMAGLGSQKDGAEFLALGDVTTALYATIGILSALLDRTATGRGQYVDIAMADSLLTLSERSMIMHGMSKRADDVRVPPISAYYLRDVLEAGDGALTIMVGTEQHWRAVAQIFGHPEWLENPLISAPESRRETIRQHVVPVIEERTRQLPKEAAAQLFQAAGIAAAPIMHAQDIVDSEHFRVRRMLVATRYDGEEPILVVGCPVKLGRFDQAGDGAPVVIATPGEHTREVLVSELGLQDADVDELIAEGVVRSSDPLGVPA
jgi:crotonobetainyl-CoA:carnitine CoA-transferase CaiB-like acyl-CoA transferase